MERAVEGFDDLIIILLLFPIFISFFFILLFFLAIYLPIRIVMDRVRTLKKKYI